MPPAIKFLHLRTRRFNRDGTTVEPAKISEHGGITLAYSYDETEQKFRYAFSICRLNENFNKRLGRIISSGYLRAGAGYTLNTVPATPISHYLTSHAIPAALKKFFHKNPGFPVKGLF